jgi:predicted acylesterase/phospholipase RssA
LPLIDRPPAVENPLPRKPRVRPIPYFEGKRVAVITTGGGGAAVSIAGIARAFEEAGIRPSFLSACSGGAIWGALWAAGLNGRQIADFSLSWRPEDYLDIQWLRLPRFALSAWRGFTGLAKGEAIEHLFDERLQRMPVGEMGSRSPRSSTTSTSTGSSTSAPSRPPISPSASWSGSPSRFRSSSSRCRCVDISTWTAA